MALVVSFLIYAFIQLWLVYKICFSDESSLMSLSIGVFHFDFVLAKMILKPY